MRTDPHTEGRPRSPPSTPSTADSAPSPPGTTPVGRHFTYKKDTCYSGITLCFPIVFSGFGRLRLQNLLELCVPARVPGDSFMCCCHTCNKSRLGDLMNELPGRRFHMHVTQDRRGSGPQASGQRPESPRPSGNMLTHSTNAYETPKCQTAQYWHSSPGDTLWPRAPQVSRRREPISREAHSRATAGSMPNRILAEAPEVLSPTFLPGQEATSPGRGT